MDISTILKRKAEGNITLSADEALALLANVEALKTKNEKLESENKAKDSVIGQLGEALQAKNSAFKELEGKLESHVLESDLNDLMNGGFHYSSIRAWDASTIPSSYRMELPEDLLSAIRGKVSVFNNTINTQGDKKITEQSGSITESNSVHFLWREILTLLLSIRPNEEKDKQQDKAVRVVYEWKVLHPKGSLFSNRMDFAFLPVTRSHVNWQDFSGGVEVKIPAMNKDGTSVIDAAGTLVTHGCMQATQRAAMGTYIRWKEAGEQGRHCCFCFFADSRKIGVVRVMIDLVDGSYNVRTEKLGPFDLPGYRDPNNPTLAQGIMMLELLAKVLHSPPNYLEELSSQPPYHTPPTVSGFLNGGAIEENGDATEETSWTLGPLIGAGGFGLVYETTDSDGEIIKIMTPSMTAVEKRKLTTEKEALDALRERIEAQSLVERFRKRFKGDNGGDLDRFFPIVSSWLASNPADNSSEVLALRFTKRGVSLATIINAAGELPENRVFLSKLIKMVQMNIEKALWIAHECSVWHNDIRKENVLIIPPDDTMNKITERLSGSESLYFSLCELLDLDSCGVMLNDWGEAIILDNNSSKIYSEKDNNLFRKMLNDFRDRTHLKRPSESNMAVVMKKQIKKSKTAAAV